MNIGAMKRHSVLMAFSLGLSRKIRLAFTGIGILMMVLMATGAAFAREEPPQNMSQEERLQWFETQCTKLDAEVKDLESRRQEYTELDAAGKRLSDRIFLDGKPMHKRLKALEDERNQNPGDRKRNEAYNKLYNQYTSRMTELIAKDVELMWRDISNFDELNGRFEAAKKAWLPVESRYPLAKAEKEWACTERDNLARDARSAQAQDPPNFRKGDIVGGIVGFIGVVEVLPEGQGRHWKQVSLNYPLVVGDVIRTRSDGMARLEFADKHLTEGGLVVINMGANTEMAISEFVVAFQQPPRTEGLFELIKGTVRYFTRGWNMDDGSFNIRSGATVCGIRGTDIAIAYEAKRDHVSFLLREGKVEISRGNERRELKAGQMITVERGVIRPVKPLDQSKWKSLVASMDVPKTSVTKAGVPSTVSSPSSSSRGKDMTRRDLPSGPQAMGGETRYDGQTFFVQSAPAYNTMTEISIEVLYDFYATTEVILGSGGQEFAGLYLSASGDPKGRPGDISFGVHSTGLVLQYRDQGGWQDLPRQARGPEKKVKLEIERRNGRYHFRWNGVKVGEYDGTLEPKRVALYAGEGVRVEFRKFQVTK